MTAHTEDTNYDEEREVVAHAEALFRASDHEAAARALFALNLPLLPVPVLDRALPVLLMSIMVTDGDARAREVLSRFESELGSKSTAAKGIGMTYRAEATDASERRREIAVQALSRLSRTETPIARHRALGVLVRAKVDMGGDLDERLLSEMTDSETGLTLTTPVDSAEAHRALLAYRVGRLDESRTLLRILRNRACVEGQPFIEQEFSAHLATVDLFAGRLAAARNELARWTAPNMGPIPPAMTLAMGLLALRTSDEAALQAALLEPTLIASESHGALTRAGLSGLAAARREDWSEAHVELSRAVELAEQIGLHEPGRRLWVDFDLARAAVALGHYDEANAATQRLNELSGGTRPLLDGVASRIHGLVMQESTPAQGLSLLEHSVSLLSGAGFPDQLALSLLEWGRALTRTGQVNEARRVLERARVLVVHTGDIAIELSIRNALMSASYDALMSALTRRERQVALSAARGATNRQIAAADSTSVRTIETQLSSVYRKLRIGSRAHLSALLSDEVREGLLRARMSDRDG